MKPLIRTSCFLFIIFIYSIAFGQMNEFDYKQEIIEISDQWHEITLPNEIFGKTNQDLTDIRIFGLNDTNDTIEAPFLLRLTAEKTSSKDVAFKTLNTSYNDNGYYFTFEIPSQESINQINLNFTNENFDWQVTLMGSQDQNEWFTVLDNYRILSIKNNQIDFQFTKLTFLSSQYRFFRLLIDSYEMPVLNKASIVQNEITAGEFREYKVKNINAKENKQAGQTEVDVEFDLPVRLSQISIGVSDTFDYYRPVTIKYLTDSFETEQGWIYNYKTLATGTLNSIEKNVFKFNSTTFQKCKIIIDNHDNQPLAIDVIEAKGYLHKLIARFNEPATYYLTFGNKKARIPKYDIERFTEKIPDKLTALKLGDELAIEKERIPVTDPLFKNKAWLWAIMTLIIILLGWFSIKMIRKN